MKIEEDESSAVDGSEEIICNVADSVPKGILLSGPRLKHRGTAGSI